MLTKRIDIRKFLSAAMDLTPDTVVTLLFYFSHKLNKKFTNNKNFNDTFQIVSQLDKTSEYANAN